ncbi:hypothetical protein SHIRM173S_12282 [Streptomyces hirsutus]
MAHGTSPHLVLFALRSFDRQHLIADNRALDYPRPDLWAAAQRGGQLFLNQQSSHPIDSGPALVATHLIPDTHHFNGRGGRTMPLLHPDGSVNTAAGLLPTSHGRSAVPGSRPRTWRRTPVPSRGTPPSPGS